MIQFKLNLASKTYSTKEEVANIQVGGRNLWVISDLVNGYTYLSV